VTAKLKMESEYIHRKKGFHVIVGRPAWWDSERGDEKIRGPIVTVMRCGLSEGRSKWNMSEASFLKNYKEA